LGTLLPRIGIATALREAFREGYRREHFLRDLGAGAVVGVIAIPLSMALAIACNVPPHHGLYTAIVAGAIAAFFGGSRHQVTGPTAAFVVVLTPIVSQHGFAGLVLATQLAGIFLFLLGLFRLGGLIEFVPYPVTTGFTAGIAVVIATIQLKDFFGLDIAHMPDHYGEKVAALFNAAGTWQPQEAILATATLLLLLIAPRLTSKVPGPLLVLPVVAVAAWLVERLLPGVEFVTIARRFSYIAADGTTHAGIPQLLPPFVLPWNWPGAGGEPLVLSFKLVQDLIPAAFAIAMLGGIESLLSAVVCDGMTGRKHNPNAELMAQGMGNVVTTFFGGFAATGAIARSAANIRFGATSPIAAVTHAVVILLSVLLIAPLLGLLPMASMAALLMLVAWNMAELRHFLHVGRISPRSDVFVLLTCFGLTVAFDMVIAVTVGMMLASLLFMRRMAEVSSVNLIGDEEGETAHGLTHGVLVYEIAGPLFFGAADRAMASIHTVGTHVHTVLFDLRRVPAMDVTGLINLETALERLRARGIRAVLAGVQGQPLHLMARAGWTSEDGTMEIVPDFHTALARVRLVSTP
jgi:SulP family sulfate permease